MRQLATNPADSAFLIDTRALILALMMLMAPVACKRQTPNPNANNAGQAPSKTTSVFDEPDLLAMPDHRVVVGLDWDVPEGWEAYDEFRSFRLATWRVEGENEGIFAFAFFMGVSMQGTIESNTSRWLLQVRNNDGTTPEQMIDTRDQGPLKITTIRIDGDSVSGMPQNELELGAQGGSLVGIIVEGSPAGHVFFRLSGPKYRVDALLPGFERMLDSIRIIEGFETP